MKELDTDSPDLDTNVAMPVIEKAKTCRLVPK